MAEFEARLVVLPERSLIDETTRLLLLKEAAADPVFEQLGIAPDFLVFLEHGPFFLRFFEELSLEGVAPEALLEGDSYAEYGEHIALLTRLKERYHALLEQHGVADRMIQAESYTLNTSFLEGFDQIVVEIEGYLSRFERTLLERVAAICPLEVVLHLSPFDQKVAEGFAPLAAETGHITTLDLSKSRLIASHRITPPENFQLYALPGRLEQVGALLDAIYRLCDEGLSPETIAVVLPDESLAPFMRRFDRHRIFNFAMGLPLSETALYLSLEALRDRLMHPDDRAVIARFNRICGQNPDLIAVSEGFFTATAQSAQTLLALLPTLRFLAACDESGEAFDVALHQIAPLLKAAGTLTPKEALHLLLSELKNRTLDDVGGGPVTVLGVLETRGVGFEAVLVPDFNEGYAPKESIKDLFLSSAVRARAGLPTRADRADLQRSLYWRLFSRSGRCLIFCTQNDQAQPSRFIKELGIQSAPTPYAYDRALLYAPAIITQRDDETIEQKIDLTQKPLYPHQLKSYLTCKRQYYYRYLRKLRGDRTLAPEAPARDLGILLHDALKALYTQPQLPAQGDLHKRLSALLLGRRDLDSRMEIEVRIWLRKLAGFFHTEGARLAHGWRPMLLEKELHARFEGVAIAGRIDRIDQLDDTLMVMDYKTGTLPKLDSPEKQSDFQLIFYALLAESLPHAHIEAAYYDLGEGALVALEDYEEQKAALRARLAAFKEPVQRFDRVEARTPCRYCEYATLCERAL
jgi:RecB family exonuclease